MNVLMQRNSVTNIANVITVKTYLKPTNYLIFECKYKLQNDLIFNLNCTV